MSSISLQKSQTLSLSKVAPALKNVRAGLAWDIRSTNGADFDLDVSALLLGENGHIRSEQDFVFYNQLGDVTLDAPQGRPRPFDPNKASVKHMGDERTGAKDGDDEEILIHLDRVPAGVKSIALVVSIHDALGRKQNFGQVENASVRLYDHDTDKELVSFDLRESASNVICLNFVSLSRDNYGDWSFNAIGEGSSDDFARFLGQFGLNL